MLHLLRAVFVCCILVQFVLPGRAAGAEKGGKKVEVHDPYEYFCGSESCYDVLELSPSANQTEIKKSYRKLAAMYHPDKNPSDEAKKRLHLVYKAYEVLTDLGEDSEGNWKKKDRFDYYLKHPREYYKVSGYHSIRDIPKSNLGLVLVGLAIIISLVMHLAASSRYKEFSLKLKNATMNNLGVKAGGTKETQELYRQAVAQYEKVVAERRKAAGGKGGKGVKMVKDPLFEKVVDEILEEAKLKDGLKEPEFNELFVVKVFMKPYELYQMFSAKKQEGGAVSEDTKAKKSS